MSTSVKFQSYAGILPQKLDNLDTDTLKWLLTDNAPNAATWQYYTDVTGELSTANGYTSGGVTLTGIATSATSGTWKLTATKGTLTASGGNIGPFRYAVLYDATADANGHKDLILYWDLGAEITIVNGNTFNLNSSGGGDWDSTNPLLQLA